MQESPLVVQDQAEIDQIISQNTQKMLEEQQRMEDSLTGVDNAAKKDSGKSSKHSKNSKSSGKQSGKRKKSKKKDEFEGIQISMSNQPTAPNSMMNQASSSIQ